MKFIPRLSRLKQAWQKIIEQINSVFKDLQDTAALLDDSDFDEPADDDGKTLKVVLADMAMHVSYHIGQIVYIHRLQGITR
ncbi:hypothetical protein [Caldalkalibacillus salinus]|uniref:hypothetical protein n=1 Tax=Caldalkalibacillus salinus TaxID=2803787 RepID=UPI001922C933|nr:hypothetical protein [Caldalkalibacillus salinus]